MQETSTGLYVSLTSFLGFGQEHVEGYYRKTGNAAFLHIYREKIELPSSNETQSEPEKKITRLAIGVEGGFDPSENKTKYEYKDHYNVVVLPDFVKIPFPNIDLPLQVILNLIEYGLHITKTVLIKDTKLLSLIHLGIRFRGKHFIS